jgi:hypothetical protein
MKTLKKFKIGAIDNSWSWEYDSSTITATLYLLSNHDLILDLNKRHVKSGLGKGVFESHIGTYGVGSLKKPEKRKINSILKENKQTYPFQRLGWYNDEYFNMSLNELLIKTTNGENNISRAIKLHELKKRIKNGK